MSNKRFNLIMHVNPDFWSDDNQYVDFPRDRFLEHTDVDIKDDFLELETEKIDRIKNLPTLFAVEHEQADTRIGKITDIEVRPTVLRVKYRFSEDHYPLTRGVLEQNWKKLGINKSGFEFHRTHWAIKEGDISGFYEEYLNTLTGIAHKLKSSDKKVQLIYAFNGTGKTRLSRAFKELIAPKNSSDDDEDETESSHPKILYYNAFTEDLFYWDNDLDKDVAPKLIIQPNDFTNWALIEQGQDQNVIANFQHYTSNKLTPEFNTDFSEVTFSFERGDDESDNNIKLSKGEESNFIWSVFYTLLDLVVETLNIEEVSERDTEQFNDLKYVFIDDPVSSLDDSHLIALAVDIAALIKKSYFNDLQGLRFIVTTHNPLFYNVLCNEFSRDDKKAGWKAKQFSKHRLEKLEDGSSQLEPQPTDSPFSYHLFLKAELKRAIEAGKIHKYHFNFLRNILEKLATFLGYSNWKELLPTTSDGSPDVYAKRIVNWGSHSKHAGDEVRDLDDEDKRVLRFLAESISEERRFHFRREVTQAATTAETAS